MRTISCAIIARIHELFGPERDAEYLKFDSELLEDIPAQAMETLRFLAAAERSETGMPLRVPDLVGHSITYRIAVGPLRGRNVFTPQTEARTPAGHGSGY